MPEEPKHFTLECGPSSDPRRYWITDIGENRPVAFGLTEEHALLIVAAVNAQFGDPKLLQEDQS